MPTHSILNTTNIRAAIDRGLSYLQQTQRPSGEFATYTSPRLDMAGAEAYSKSVYVTTFVIHSLCYLPDHPLIAPMQQRAARFLIGEQEEFGGWNYEGRGKWRVPPDLDDTSCAVAALFKLGYQPDLSFYMLLWQNEATLSGPYYTWIGINDRLNDRRAKKVDALVNANILFCAGLLDLSLPNTVSYLFKTVQTEAYQSHDLYWLSPYLFIYALSRAYADGQVSALAPTISILQNHILNKFSPPQAEPSLFNIACLAVSLLNFQANLTQIEPYLVALLNGQQTNGGWPAWATYAGWAPNYDGAPALTTAFALEALGKWLAIGGESF